MEKVENVAYIFNRNFKKLINYPQGLIEFSEKSKLSLERLEKIYNGEEEPYYSEIILICSYFKRTPQSLIEPKVNIKDDTKNNARLIAQNELTFNNQMSLLKSENVDLN